MITEELLSYIKKQLEAGHSEETIKKILVDHKWKQEDVTQAFSTILGAKPQNTQGDVASIMRPGFAGGQAQMQSQPQPQQVERPVSEFSQPQSQVQSQPQYQPQQFAQPQPIAQPAQVQYQPQVEPVQNAPKVTEVKPETSFGINPKLQKQEFVSTPAQSVQTQPAPIVEPKVEIKLEPKPIEVKSEGPVFMPKTFNSKPIGAIEPEKKVSFGSVIKPEEVKVVPQVESDLENDLYKELVTQTPEVKRDLPFSGFEKINQASKIQTQTQTQSPKNQGERVIGQSLLKPKTFSPQSGSNIQNNFPKMQTTDYGRYATPQANENMPTLNKPAFPKAPGMSPNVYEKPRPDAETLREAQSKMPVQMANQSNPNITSSPVVETQKGGGAFLKKFLTIFIIVIVLGGGLYAYMNFFGGGIRQDSKFMEKFQNVYMADFEINMSGPFLSGVFPSSEDPTLLTAKIKGFTDVADSSNKISNFEVSIKNNQELNFNIVSTSSSSYIYTSFEDFSLKDQWIQLNGPFVQSFLPSFFDGTLPNGLMSDSGSILPEASFVKIRQLFSQFDVFKLTFDKGRDEINGQNMNVYSFEMDKGAMNLYLEQVAVLSKGSSGFEKSIESIKKLINGMELKEGTVWIGKDRLPHRFMMTFTTLGNTATSQINIEVNSYNQKKNVSLPANFVKPAGGANGVSFAEGELKNSMRSILVDLQSIANTFRTSNSGSFVGICQDSASGFMARFKEIETISPNTTPICKDGVDGFLVGAKYSEEKFLCVDRLKITESDEAGVNNAGLSCAISKEATIEDSYIKETITAFAGVANVFKTQNQNSFAGICASSSYSIFSRGLDSAVKKTSECLSTQTGFAVFAPLSTGEYACIDATAKYTISPTRRTTASCK